MGNDFPHFAWSCQVLPADINVNLVVRGAIADICEVIRQPRMLDKIHAGIHAAYTRAKEGVAPSGWKFADGVFRALTAAEVIEMADAIFARVDACFAREAVLLSELEAGTYTDAMLGEGWPA